MVTVPGEKSAIRGNGADLSHGADIRLYGAHMMTIQVTGTLFVALMLAAVMFYFGGSLIKQLGESRGLMTLEDAGETGLTLGLFLVNLMVMAMLLRIIAQMEKKGQVRRKVFK